MRSRLFAYVAIAAAVLGGFALVADALSTSDEEAVEALVDDLAEDAGSGVLAWTDPGLEPVSLQRHGNVARFSGGDESDLDDAVADALSGFDAGDLEVVQRSVDVNGDRASVAVRARADGEMHDAQFRLVRREGVWLVTRIVAG